MKLRWMMATVTAVALAACSGGGSPTPAPSARPSSTATLTILEPQPGAVIRGGDVRVRLRLDGAMITNRVSTNLQPNVGHIHLRVDGTTITLLGSLDEVIPDVASGQHVLEAEFVAVDHGPFDPRVISTATFTVP